MEKHDQKPASCCGDWLSGFWYNRVIYRPTSFPPSHAECSCSLKFLFFTCRFGPMPTIIPLRHKLRKACLHFCRFGLLLYYHFYHHWLRRYNPQCAPNQTCRIAHGHHRPILFGGIGGNYYQQIFIKSKNPLKHACW